VAPVPLGGTESIVAIDKKSGEIGAAVVSQSFSAGPQTIWAEQGVGVVVVQGTVEPTYGPLGLALLKGGMTPAHALKSLLATDPRPDVRQVMMMNSRGRVVAHSGKRCLPESGCQVGRGFCVQANFVNAKSVWRAVAAAFRAGKGTLAERLVSALEAGARASNGPRRGGGSRSAAVTVVSTNHTNTPEEGRLVDLRVENSDAPLRELRAALKVKEAYELAASGEDLLLRGEMAKAEREFARAISLGQGSTELRLRFALAMLKAGEEKKGESLLKTVVGGGKDAKATLREMAVRGITGAPAKNKSSASQT